MAQEMAQELHLITIMDTMDAIILMCLIIPILTTHILHPSILIQHNGQRLQAVVSTVTTVD
jgi:hypothetical protein